MRYGKLILPKEIAAIHKNNWKLYNMSIEKILFSTQWARNGKNE